MPAYTVFDLIFIGVAIMYAYYIIVMKNKKK